MVDLHELVTTLAAPWAVLSPRSGQVTGAGAEGVFARDRRVLSRLAVTLDGRQPVAVHVDEPSAGTTVYSAVADNLGDQGHDPTVVLRRTRELAGDGLRERLTVVNRSRNAVETSLVVALGTDLAGTAAIRSEAAVGQPTVDAEWDGSALRWSAGGTQVTVTAVPAAAGDGSGVLGWELTVPAGGETSVELVVTATFPAPTGFTIAPPAERTRYEVEVECDDSRVARWLRRSLADVSGLELRADESDRYLGAGPPWYLTLFGRDALISAGMLIPVDLALAGGTLRALARRQGTKVDPGSAEQPGKIPHELRAEVADHGGGLVLPAAYYGTHDATPLWVTTLHKAWRWGMPRSEVAELLPALRAALGWIRDYADPDGDGFLEYVDESGHGLANQGWKDSRDAVQWPDGTLATAPIALCEVQGYAYAAAVAGAELLDAFGQPGGEWLTWAAELKTRFRAHFWVDGYPAIALDGDKRPVAGPASNMGHLLGTGLLDPDEEAVVARLLGDDRLDSGFGLRTLSTAMAGFNPLGYHTGSVWPHDTAMAVQGLYAAGQATTATKYVRSLVEAAESFRYRLPEVYGGAGTDSESAPTPYPLSCRPQAWAAASAVAVVVAALGIEPHVPRGTLDLTPAADFPWRRLRLSGLRLGEHPFSVRFEDGKLSVQ